MNELKEKELFLENSLVGLSEIWDHLHKKEGFKVQSVNPYKCAYIMVDMINGFAREGALSSQRVEKLINPIVAGARLMDALNIPKLAFADSHTMASPEFTSYPPHCLFGTSEAEIVDEIKAVGGYELIQKNSTNGFLEPAFVNWLEKYSDVTTFIVTGDCTDICVSQFAIALKTHFDRLNKFCQIIVPMNLVDTYDLGMHKGDLLHIMALYMMEMNGITLVKSLS